MSKFRLESLSDNVISIIMTLMAFNIGSSLSYQPLDEIQLWSELSHIYPTFVVYFASFFIIGTYWLTHSYLISSYAKNISRKLIALNLIFLSFISLIPFSSRLVGTYSNSQIAVVIFGVNMLFTSTLAFMIFLYILKSKQIENFSIDHTRIRNTYFRLSLPILGSMLGILIAGLSTQIALALYFIPIIFNFFPISMSELEKRIRTMSSKESQNPIQNSI
jgi:uncharacterized membrane protein